MIYRGTHRAGCVAEKAYNIHIREFKAITFVKDDGRVSAIPTYRVYKLYDECMRRVYSISLCTKQLDSYLETIVY